MKLLTWTAIAALAIGAITAAVAGITWPTYTVVDAMNAYERALNTHAAAGAELPDISEYMTSPTGFYVGHYAALAVGGFLFAVGTLAGLLALHARAVRQPFTIQGNTYA